MSVSHYKEAVFKDESGKTYKIDEVVFEDVDNPGAQFLGWVTKASREASNNVDKWVRVTPCG